MKPAPFKFFAPSSRDEALRLLGECGEDGRVLAGGQSLVPLMNMRMVQPEILVSINGCADLDYVSDDGDTIAVGALTRQAVAAENETITQQCPLLALCLPYVGGSASLNRGTVCGSLAHADPVAELPAVAVALDAGFRVSSTGGTRDVAADAFFVSELTTCLEPGEMLEAVSFPKADKDDRAAFVEVGNRKHGFALVAVAAQLKIDSEGACSAARLAAVGVGATAVRLRAAEESLVGEKASDAAFAAAAEAARNAVDPVDDFHADASYRRRVLGVLVTRALRQIRSDGVGTKKGREQ